MEFPHLGKHCSEKSCNKLDFLPMSCDACQLIFCSGHFSYQKHNCTSAHKKDVQVPACPLCGEPVPTPRGISPDMTVGQHIDQYCKSDKTKIFTNKCSYKNCKKKELIPVQCTVCRYNYCLRHRHTSDHNCNPANARRNLLANAANSRTIGNNINGNTTNAANKTNSSSSSSPNHHAQSIQGNMSEDEALAHALARSIQELDETHDRNHRRNLQQQQQQPTVPCADGTTTTTTTTTTNKDKCSLS